ncbi:hypothetical protein NL676_016501 [Syzygium grande]|nr:hypothetical protein NL676_016501 [Syzygium grande]
MAEDWDLSALVRSCSSAAAAASAAAPGSENPLACLASLTFGEEEDGPFGIPNLVEPRNGALDELQELYRPFYPDVDRSLSFASDFAAANGFRAPVSPKAAIGPRCNRASSAPAIGALQAPTPLPPPPPPPQLKMKQAVHHQGFDRKVLPARPVSSTFPLPAMQAQTPRSRKRKSQQKKSVCHVTAENLSSDPWAWRTITDAVAPKVVRRGSKWSGATPTRTSSSSPIPATTPTPVPPTATPSPAAPATSSPPPPPLSRNQTRSARPIPLPPPRAPPPPPASPRRPPLTAPIDEEVAHHGALLISEDLGMDKESEDLVGDDEDNDREEEDEDDLLIPNVGAMSEEIFMGFRELGRSPASGDNFSSGPGRADFTRFSSAAAGAGGGP